MSLHDMAEYWPNPAPGQMQVVQDAYLSNGVEILTKTANYHWQGEVGGRPVIRIDELNGGVWSDAWEYVFDSERGVLEVGDWEQDFALVNFLAKHGITKKLTTAHKVFKPGRELAWGGKMQIGDVVEGKVEIDMAKSSKVIPFFGVKGRYETELLGAIPNFVNDGGHAFNDVVLIYNRQDFYHFLGLSIFGKETWEVRRWHAPGVGVVQIEYRNQVDGSWGRHYAKSIITKPAVG